MISVVDDMKYLKVRYLIVPILLIASYGVFLFWRELGGNSLFVFRGRVVDQTGEAVPGVQVDAEITYRKTLHPPILFSNGEGSEGRRIRGHS